MAHEKEECASKARQPDICSVALRGWRHKGGSALSTLTDDAKVIVCLAVGTVARHRQHERLVQARTCNRVCCGSVCVCVCE